MAKHGNGRHQGGQHHDRDQGRSGGQRSSSGSNYGDWRPDLQRRKTRQSEPSGASGMSGGDGEGSTGSDLLSGTAPSTAPSGIGSKPNK